MLKKIGYGDTLRADGVKDDTIKLLNKDDYRTPWDINRPIEEIYKEVESLYSFLNYVSLQKLTGEGVFKDSLFSEFKFDETQCQTVRLFDKRDASSLSYVDKNYSFIKPGVAGVFHTDEREENLLCVYKPNIREFEKQLAYILHSKVHEEKQGVWIKYVAETNLYKAKIIKQTHPDGTTVEILIGDFDNDDINGLTLIDLLVEIYNNEYLNTYIVNEIGNSLEKFLLFPIFELTATGNFNWMIENGEVKLSSTGLGFFLASFTVDTISPLTISNINETHRLYGENVKEIIHGDDVKSYEMTSNGGVEFDIKKGFRVSSLSGYEFDLKENGDVVLSTAAGRNLTISSTLFNYNGILEVVSNGVGEYFSEDITLKTQNYGTETKVVVDLTENITNETRTIETVIENITNETRTVGTVIENITDETRTVGTLTETITNTNTNTAESQRITGITDIVIAAPSITLDAGETGIVSIIGEQQIIEGNTVTLEDNVILLNKNQVGTPAAGLISGLETERGDVENSLFVFREQDDTYGVGVASDIKTIARKEDNVNSIDTGIPFFNKTTEVLETEIKFQHNKTTGTTICNTDDAENTPPFITNSYNKVSNLNVDAVDGVHIDNTDAVVDDICIWNSNTGLKSSNRKFITTMSRTSQSDDEIPTGNAVINFVDANFVAVDTVVVSNLTKGISISYEDGDEVLKSTIIENIDVDTVDGVHINNTNVEADDICVWSSTTGLKTSNIKVSTTVVADTNLPDNNSVIDYFNSRIMTGSGIFNSDTGVVITHTFGSIPTAVQITASSNPVGYLGEIWTEKTDTTFTVFCSGATTTATFDYSIFK